MATTLPASFILNHNPTKSTKMAGPKDLGLIFHSDGFCDFQAAPAGSISLDEQSSPWKRKRAENGIAKKETNVSNDTPSTPSTPLQRMSIENTSISNGSHETTPQKRKGPENGLTKNEPPSEPIERKSAENGTAKKEVSVSPTLLKRKAVENESDRSWLKFTWQTFKKLVS